MAQRTRWTGAGIARFASCLASKAFVIVPLGQRGSFGGRRWISPHQDKRMLRTILAYILAFIVLGWLSALFLGPFLPVMLATTRNKMAPLVSFCASAVSMFVATFFLFWICTKLGVSPAYAMFVLPILVMLSNDRNRIQNAKLGLAQRKARSEEPFNEIFVKMEYGYLIGDIIGLSSALFIRGQLPLYYLPPNEVVGPERW